MKKHLFIILLAVTTTFITSIKEVKASHFAGAEITYSCLGGNNYEITLVFYRDCGGVSTPGSVNILLNCTSNSVFNQTITLNKISGTGQEITKPCPSTTTYCSGGNSFGIQEHVYKGNVVLVPCNHWIMSYHSCCRNSVNTVQNNTSNPWYIKAVLDNMSAPQSSSPKFLQKPVFIVYSGQNYKLNMGATDPNGDSLSFSLYNPLKDTSQTISYSSPYSYTNFLSSSTPITFDPQTGLITFNSNISLNTVLGIKVTKWRKINGVPTIVGEIYRDVELKTISGNNHMPELSGMDFTNSHQFNPNDTIFFKEVCHGEVLDFDINAFDIDSGSTNNGKMTMNSTFTIPGATFTVHNNGTDSVYGHFHWTANNNYSNKRCFTVLLNDLGCPYNGQQVSSYCFIVKDTVSLSLNTSDTMLCTGDTLVLQAQTTAQNPAFVWMKNGQTITGATGSSYTVNTNNYQTGQDTFSVVLQASNTYCSANGNLMINHVYQPHIYLTLQDTGIAIPGDSIVYDAGQGMLYKWMDQNNTVLGTAQTQAFTKSGLYHVIVDGGNNTRCTDADTFAIWVAGIENHKPEGGVLIIPNPNNGQFMLKIDNDKFASGKYTVEITSQDGKVIYSRKIKNRKEVKIDLGSAAKGIYQIVISNTNQRLTSRIVIR